MWRHVPLSFKYEKSQWAFLTSAWFFWRILTGFQVSNIFTFDLLNVRGLQAAVSRCLCCALVIFKIRRKVQSQARVTNQLLYGRLQYFRWFQAWGRSLGSSELDPRWYWAMTGCQVVLRAWQNSLLVWGPFIWTFLDCLSNICGWDWCHLIRKPLMLEVISRWHWRTPRVTKFLSPCRTYNFGP